MRLTACAVALLLGVLPVVSASADPLAPPEAAALTTRLLDGKVWLVHAIIVRVIDGDTVVLNMDLGWLLTLEQLLSMMAQAFIPQVDVDS
jgi:hypothetical protein